MPLATPTKISRSLLLSRDWIGSSGGATRIVILLGRLALPIEIRRIVRRHFDGRLSGKDRILFRASAAEQQVFHAVDVVYLRGVVVPVEYDISISLA